MMCYLLHALIAPPPIVAELLKKLLIPQKVSTALCNAWSAPPNPMIFSAWLLKNFLFPEKRSTVLCDARIAPPEKCFAELLKKLLVSLKVLPCEL